MAGFVDLVPAAMPYLAVEEMSGAVGSSWEWLYYIEDGSGDPVDFTGCTGTAVIKTGINGTVVVTPLVTFPAVGVVKCAVSSAVSATLTPGRSYVHEVEIADGVDRKVKLVGGGVSKFVVLPEVTA